MMNSGNERDPSSDRSIPGREFFLNNPVTENVVRPRVQDFARDTMAVSLNAMTRYFSSIKYYFAVDHNYVVAKLSLLLFPFRARDWSPRYSADEPIPPRLDTNAPDYYIPLMSAITYVLLVGVILGTQNKFTPEQLGTHASSLLVWNIIENCLLRLVFYIFHAQSNVRILDLIAYCGYKYVGIIAILLLYLITHSLLIYRCALLYFSISISYFLIQSFRLQILPNTDGSSSYDQRRTYTLLFIVILQAVFIWYFTRHLIVI